MPLPESEAQVLLLHNPSCSKSRGLKALLEERAVDYTERLYLEDPLDRSELVDLLSRLDAPTIKLVRTRESEFDEEGLSRDSSDDALLEALTRHPGLMERPVLVRGSQAAIGRPGPADALRIL